MNKRNPAGITVRSRKADMYAEIERLRALLDAQDSEVAMLRESNMRLEDRLANAVDAFRALRAERDALKAKSEEQGALHRDLNEIARRASVLLKRSTQVRDGRVEQYVGGVWTPVPPRVLHYASKS